MRSVATRAGADPGDAPVAATGSGCPSGTGRASIASIRAALVWRQLRHSCACECPAFSPCVRSPDAVATVSANASSTSAGIGSPSR